MLACLVYYFDENMIKKKKNRNKLDININLYIHTIKFIKFIGFII